MNDYPPTAEQQACIDAAMSGEPLVIEARAGAGKTSTLVFVAAEKDRTREAGMFVAFNKAIVVDSRARFPRSVKCSTAHALAMAEVGRKYSHRLQARRLNAQETARAIGATPITVEVLGGEKMRFAAGWCGSAAMRMVESFCRSAEPEVRWWHAPDVPGLDMPGESTNRRVLGEALLPAARAAWADLSRTDGKLRFSHNHYLKLWQLSDPTLPVDYVLLDEAQDTNPVLGAVIERQTHAQVILVGDPNQAIYEWNGAVDAMAKFTGTRCDLSESFRFGPAIARVAQRILNTLDGARIVGSGPDGRVGEISAPGTLIARTNAGVIENALEQIKAGRRVAVVGGAGELVAFAEAAAALQAGSWTSHPELACFKTWGEVQDYASNDLLGHELSLLVRLIDDYGADVIVDQLGNAVDEADADVILTTAHKSKGREWDSVRVLGDWPKIDGSVFLTEPERRLLYVAVTRATRELEVHPSITKSLDAFKRPTPVAGLV